MTKNGKIKSSKEKAGGFGALANSLKQVARHGDAVKTSTSLWNVNQPDGFDCPGCAWPDPDGPGPFEFCENGVKAVAWETTARRVTPEFFYRHTVSELNQKSDFWLEDQGRLTHPMKYNSTKDQYSKLSWDDAFSLIGKHLNELNDPNEAIFYTSGRTSNEAAFLYQLFGRMYGTNNFPDCSNMCHESSGVALNESIGIGKGTVTLEDFDHADLIMIVGQNPGTNHPRMMTTLQKASRRGAKIVAINPLKEAALKSFAHPKEPLQLLGSKTPIATHFYQPMIGGDQALFFGVCKWIFENAPDKLATKFIGEHTAGFENFRQSILELCDDTILKQSGLGTEEIEEIAKLYCDSNRVIICWAMGLTQQEHAVAIIQSITNLLLLRGNIGKRGAGACPVRGHSNVQGDRTVGITEKPSKPFLEKLGKAFNFTPPTEHGLDTVGAIEVMQNGKAKIFIGMGGNFVAATPDTENTIQAMGKCNLTVHISTKLNRSHLTCGKDALILPCLGRTEQDLTGEQWQRVTVEDSMSMVHASSGKAKPASKHLLSEPAIVAGIAKATLINSSVDWEELIKDYDRIREKIEEVVPGFEGYNEKIKKPGGFHLRNSAREREWNTKNGKANFCFDELLEFNHPDCLRLMTIRSHDQFNTTVYGMDDRYRGVYGTREVIFMNAEDMKSLNLNADDLVTILTVHSDEKERKVSGFRVVPFDIPKGCAAGYFPELNPLVPADKFAKKSRTPVSKFITVTIAKDERQET